MKILVISDTHYDADTMEQVIHHHTEVDAIIHCGDSELDRAYFDGSSVQVVRGNCDFDLNFPEEIIVPVETEKILVVHGHKHRVKTTLLPLIYRAQEIQASIVCFGHSHILGAELNNGILFVNPGSLHMPRGRKEKSYALIEKSEAICMVTFYSSENKIIEQVNFF